MQLLYYCSILEVGYRPINKKIVWDVVKLLYGLVNKFNSNVASLYNKYGYNLDWLQPITFPSFPWFIAGH